MKVLNTIGLSEVQEVYSGAEGDLWELVMGEQIHIGGFTSSMDLATKAEIQPGSRGVDFCCCTGAGMRFLVRFCEVARMTGVDATERMVQRGRQRCADEGLDHAISFTQADVCDSGLPSESVDFVWGEDAWCYVVDKPKLISEAARLIKPGGKVAVTDWVEGPTPLSDEEADRFLRFMKFPTLLDTDDYCGLLEGNGCKVIHAENTERYAPSVELYCDMLERQLTFDALKVIGFDMEMMQILGGEMHFIRELARAGKVIQGLFVAEKKG